jgi:type II secretory pathway component PulF
MQAENYSYRARNATNQVVTGVVQAPSVEAAKKILLQNQLTPLSISVPKTLTDILPFFNKVAPKEKTLFARQLATMIEAGLSLSQALRLLIRQSKKGKFQSILEAVLNDLQDGFSFSTALTKFPDVFDPIFINVVRSGEATGKLEVVLKELATNLEKNLVVAGKIKGALFYPSFIIGAMFIVGGIMITVVIPQLKDVFSSAGQKLPASTRSLLALSDFMVHRWYVIVIGLPFVFLGLRYFLRTPAGQNFYSRVIFKVPIANSIMIQSTMARLGRLLGMLLGSGVPLLEALRLINDAFTNKVYQRAIVEVATQVERGIPMSVPISDNPVFPLMVGQMVAVGEQTGKMDEIMTRLAEYFEQEVESKVSGISSLIEPIIILVLGFAVAYLVIAILLPIYQISTAVS